MQYFLRFYLACAVVMSHLWADAFGSTGSYAVCGFFVISGYVITMVLQQRYLNLQNGVRKFWLNRFLRLYPAFLVVTIFGYWVSRFAPLQAGALSVGLLLPESDLGRQAIASAGVPSAWWPIFYIANLTMIGLQAPFFWTSPITFAPTATSTSIELYYYALLSLGAAASARASRRFLAVSLALLASLPVLYILRELGFYRYGVWSPGITINAFSLFYKTILGWSFFFALGCAAYFIPKLELPSPVRLGILFVCLALPFVYVQSVYALIALRIVFGIWVALTILSFSDDRGSAVVRFLGDLSYPLFLIHWPMAALVSWATGMVKNDAVFLIVSLGMSLAASAAIVVLIERPVESIRRRYRT